MKVIGITGGVGSGKSEVINLLTDMCDCVVIRADELAKKLEEKGEVCYEPIVKLLGNKILNDDGSINNKKMAEAIFEDKDNDKLEKVNEIIHPAVKKWIIKHIEKCKIDNNYKYYFLEAALLIEDHYELICDELWYIYADEEVRARRLKESRGYSDSKIEGIMKSQLSEEVFRQKCARVIDNSKTLEYTREQLFQIIDK